MKHGFRLLMLNLMGGRKTRGVGRRRGGKGFTEKKTSTKRRSCKNHAFSTCQYHWAPNREV